MENIATIKNLIYNGDSDPVVFAQEFDLQTILAEWNDENAFKFLPHFLKGKAKRLVEAALASTNKPTTVTHIMKILKDGCEVPRTMLMYQFFERRKRPTESVSKFARSLQDLLIRASPTMDIDCQTDLLRAQLCLSVPEHLRAMIQFSEAFGTANWDKMLSVLDKTLITTSDTISAAEPYFKQECNSTIKAEPTLDTNYTEACGTNFLAAECNRLQAQLKAATFKTKRFDGNCDECGLYGHKAVDCRRRLERTSNYNRNQNDRPGFDRRSSYNSSSSNNAKSAPSSFSRFNPKNRQASSNNTEYSEEGNDNQLYEQASEQSNEDQEFPFYAYNSAIELIEMNNTESNKKLIFIDADASLFDSPKPIHVKALVDDGSTHSFLAHSALSRVLIDKLNAHDPKFCFAQQFKIKSATHSTDEKCVVIKADLKIGNWYGTHEFVISKAVENYEMILGIDFLRQNKVVIDHGTDSIRFGNIIINETHAEQVQTSSKIEEI